MINIVEWSRILLPFINEFANLLTLSGFSKFYIHNPQTNTDLVNKLIIDFIALSAIIWNACYITQKENITHGIIKGVIIIFLAFIVPNLFLHKLIDLCTMCIEKNQTNKLLSGLFIIGVLLALEVIIYKYSIILIDKLFKKKFKSKTKETFKKKV